jgi:hypothetical protein
VRQKTNIFITITLLFLLQNASYYKYFGDKDKELNGIKEFKENKIMKKVMISQPMRGKTEDFKVRLVEEYDKLIDRKHKLFDFTQTDKFNELDERMQLHMLHQLNAMELNGFHLGERIFVLGIES